MYLFIKRRRRNGRFVYRRAPTFQGLVAYKIDINYNFVIQGKIKSEGVAVVPDARPKLLKLYPENK